MEQGFGEDLPHTDVALSWVVTDYVFSFSLKAGGREWGRGISWVVTDYVFSFSLKAGYVGDLSVGKGEGGRGISW